MIVSVNMKLYVMKKLYLIDTFSGRLKLLGCVLMEAIAEVKVALKGYQKRGWVMSAMLGMKPY